MNMVQAAILGLVEGLSEFLPISSTAHLIIASALLKIPSSDFLKTFEISIQLGAILAAFLLYWKKFIKSPKIISRVAVAFLVTSFIGLIFYKLVKDYLMDSYPLIAASLFLGGLFIIAFERYHAKKAAAKKEINLEEMSLKQAATIGACQAVAIVPGVSRSAATIIGGLAFNIKREEIVEFSFLLAIPTMAAATFLDVYKSRLLIAALSGNDWLAWLIGFVVSFITAIIGAKFLIHYIQKNDFQYFGWYRIIIALLISFWIIA
jgi:undecaprenyl-diphosphatase